MSTEAGDNTQNQVIEGLLKARLRRKKFSDGMRSIKKEFIGWTAKWTSFPENYMKGTPTGNL